jgi:hypothetical protein
MTRGLLKLHGSRRNAMTNLASIRPNDITGDFPSRPRPALTQEQVFRLLRCAIKDDEELVDEIIEQVYQNIVAFDYKRAECVIELIVRRSVTARWAFRSLLKDMRTVDAPAAALLGRPYSGRNREPAAIDRF